MLENEGIIWQEFHLDLILTTRLVAEGVGSMAHDVSWDQKQQLRESCHQMHTEPEAKPQQVHMKWTWTWALGQKLYRSEVRQNSLKKKILGGFSISESSCCPWTSDSLLRPQNLLYKQSHKTGIGINHTVWSRGLAIVPHRSGLQLWAKICAKCCD